MFVVPTIRFQVLYILIMLGLERRRLVFANVTTNPTAEWLAQQVVNTFPWNTAPRFLIRRASASTKSAPPCERR
jgi:hypothetical protein